MLCVSTHPSGKMLDHIRKFCTLSVVGKETSDHLWVYDMMCNQQLAYTQPPTLSGIGNDEYQ